MFELDDKQVLSANEFIKDHDCTIPKRHGVPYVGAIGGRISYTFTPTGLGMCVSVNCACGKSKDLTDVSDW